jgi:hypothetical protein
MRFNREAYTAAKGPFVERILAAALGRDEQRTIQQDAASDVR